MFKKKTLKKGWASSIVLVLLITLAIGIMLSGCQGRNADATASTVETPQTEARASAEEKILLYWNLDRSLYTGGSSDGAVREKEADGYYHVRFSVDGETVEYKVSGARLMENIDKHDLMGLEFDTDGYVVDVVDVADLTAGEVAVGEYVVFAGDTSITTCESKNLEGKYTTYQYAANVGIYNVMGQEPVGFIDKPEPVDTIRAFVNDAGEITHIYILTRLDYFAGPTQTVFCPECQKDVAWREWSDTTTLPNQDGHYYLANDITLENAATLEKNINVSVDLNGKTVSATSRRMYVINSGAKLTLIDSVGTGKMVGYRGKAGDPSSTVGGMFYLNKGNGQTLNIYGGTYDASQIYLKDNGGVIAMNENQGTFNMYGGTLIGAGTCSKGGAVYASNGTTFNMAGGTISGGHAEESGDNVYIQIGATFTNNGGTIDGGIQDGNIMSGDPIYHCLCGSTTDVHIGKCDGTELEWLPWEDSGTLPSSSGNFYLTDIVYISKAATLKNVNLNLDLNGFWVTADTQRFFVVEGSTKLNIVDSVGTGGMVGTRTKGGSDGAMILLNTDCTATVSLYGGTLDASRIVSNKEGGVVAIRASSGVFNMYGGMIISAADSKAGDAVFLNAGSTFNMYGGWIADWNPDASSKLVVVRSGAVFKHIGGGITENKEKPAVTRQACLCGSTTNNHIGECDGTILTWTAWTDTTMPNKAGNWYLTTDMTIKNETGYTTVTLTGASMNLDLNGHTVTANSQRVYVLNKNAVLNITDTVGDGQIKGVRGSGSTTGAMLYLNKDATNGSSVSLYGGTLDASGISVTGKGAVTAINANQGTFNMYGGKIIGGTCASGDAVYLASGTTFNMTGGEITDTNTTDEAKLLVVAENGATFKQTGGTITEYADSEPDPEPEGLVHCLCGSTGTHLGNCDGSQLVWKPWTGTAMPDTAGNWYLTTDMTIKNQTGYTTVTLTNVSINLDLNGHTVTANSQRVYVLNKNAVLNIMDSAGGGKIKGVRGSGTTTGAMFYLNKDATDAGTALSLYSGTLDASEIKVTGKGAVAAINANQGAFNMYGGKIIGGTCASGDAVYLASGATFNMSGGEITDTNTTDEAKLLVVAAEGAAFNQTGGTITEYAATPAPEPEPEPEGHVHCLCGASTDTANACGICGSVAVAYTVWDGITTPSEAGNYYLSGDATATATLFNVDYDLNICLCGHCLTAKAQTRAVTVTKGNTVVITGGCGSANGGSIYGVQGGTKIGDAIYAKKGTLKLYNLTVSSTAKTVKSGGSLIEVGDGTSSNIGKVIAANCTLKAINCSKDVTGYALVRVKTSSVVNGAAVAKDTIYAQTEGGWNRFTDQNYTGHSWSEATCTEPKTCSVCTATEGDALGHSYSTDYLVENADENKHYHACTLCGEKDSGADHTWNLEAATETEDKYCTVCGYVGEAKKAHIHCRCGASTDTSNACGICGSVAVTYTAVTGIPTTAGNYYLTNNVTLSSAVTLADGCNLCLNGCTVNGPTGGRALQITASTAKVVITNGSHTSSGTIASKRSNKGTGTCLFVKAGTCSVYGVIFDGTGYGGASAGVGSLIEVGTASSAAALTLNSCYVKMPASVHADYSNLKAFAGCTLNGTILAATTSYNDTIPGRLTVS